LTAFVTWIGLSAFWSQSVPGSVREVERDIVYVGLAFALAVFGRYLSARGLALGVLAGITAVTGYALTTRLFPTHFAPPDPTFAYQLSVPLGYWNAMGLISAMGSILALGVAAQAQARVVRMLAGAATCVIVPAMLFTFSRGAWVAAVVGVVVLAALDSHRVALTAALLAIVGPVGILVWLGATSTPLTDVHATVAAAAHSGRRYALAVILLGCAAAVLTELAHMGVTRLGPGRTAERRLVVGYVVGLVVVAVGVVTAAGGPVRAVDRSWSAFRGGFNVQSNNLSDRFRSFSNHGRIEHWRVAVVDYRNHPVLGSGAGTYEQNWYRLRRNDLTIRDAHSLYLEVLAEVGPLGLLLLLGTLAVPLVALTRARSDTHVPAAAGAFAAFLVHAGIDWDWEVVGLTVTAILVGSVGLLAAGPGSPSIALGRRTRVALVSVAGVAAAFAFVSFAGNREVAASERAVSQGNPAPAAARARQAIRLLRWSPEPWVALGDAQLAGGDRAGARSSYEQAAAKDPGNWRVWAALADATSGTAHRRALHEVRVLNPRYNPAAG
jgi:O-antigen ligase